MHASTSTGPTGWNTPSSSAPRAVPVPGGPGSEGPESQACRSHRLPMQTREQLVAFICPAIGDEQGGRAYALACAQRRSPALGLERRAPRATSAYVPRPRRTGPIQPWVANCTSGSCKHQSGHNRHRRRRAAAPGLLEPRARASHRLPLWTNRGSLIDEHLSSGSVGKQSSSTRAGDARLGAKPIASGGDRRRNESSGGATADPLGAGQPGNARTAGPCRVSSGVDRRAVRWIFSPGLTG
jgi:hypothetical protein